MNERSYPLHPRLALLLLTLLAGFVGFLSLVPLTQGAPILGAAIALGAAAVLIVSILLQRDRVIVAPDRIEVEGTFRAQVFPFAKLGPGALSIARLSIVLTPPDPNTGKPFEVPPGARAYYPILEALHTALDQEGSNRGTALLESLRERMLAALFGGGASAGDLVSDPASHGLAEVANQRLLNQLRAFLEERLGPTPGLRPIGGG